MTHDEDTGKQERWDSTVGFIEEENAIHVPEVTLEEITRGDGSKGYAIDAPVLGLGDAALNPVAPEPVEVFPGPTTGVMFELAVFATTAWPPSCTPVGDALGAIRRCLHAASQGQEKAFKTAQRDVSAALNNWARDLWAK